MSANNSELENISKAILSGNGTASVEASNKALESGTGIDEIVMNGILKAWSKFCAWYDRDPKESLKAWLDCYDATQKILKHLETKMSLPQNPPFSVLVVIVKGEGHILMRDIVATMLRSKGLKVYSSKKGVLIEDLREPLADLSLKYALLSCIESSTQQKAAVLIKEIKKSQAGPHYNSWWSYSPVRGGRYCRF